ncbi:glucosaminidase domain-containing protein [Aureispira]|nr:glucosaminidase domain-containing protein [Aureispira sp.]
MKTIINNFPIEIKHILVEHLHKTKAYVKQIWIRVLIFSLIAIIISQKEFSFHFTIGSPNHKIANNNYLPLQNHTSTNPTTYKKSSVGAANINPTEKKWWQTIRDEKKDIRIKLNLGNPATAVSAVLSPKQQKEAAKFSNLGFLLNPNFAHKHNIDPAIVANKNQICFNYIAKFSVTAKEEAAIFNIPASITLAQGLLESNVGQSTLAVKEKNHFGIKCRKKCIGCRCANYTDDSRYDMFRIFDSAWESYREHSKLLSMKRYKHLTKLKITNYKEWAWGLQNAGYATDKKYAKKLIEIIKRLKLYQYDK